MLALPLLILMGSLVMADDTPKVLFVFTGADAAKEWQSVNDGVMGGVSEGRFKITDNKTMEFFGTLSLENNGASPRCGRRPRSWDWRRAIRWSPR